MAIKVINSEWVPTLNDSKKEYVVDTEADISALPTCCAGSSALVVGTGAIYMVNASGVWEPFGG